MVSFDFSLKVIQQLYLFTGWLLLVYRFGLDWALWVAVSVMVLYLGYHGLRRGYTWYKDRDQDQVKDRVLPFRNPYKLTFQVAKGMWRKYLPILFFLAGSVVFKSISQYFWLKLPEALETGSSTKAIQLAFLRALFDGLGSLSTTLMFMWKSKVDIQVLLSVKKRVWDFYLKQSRKERRQQKKDFRQQWSKNERVPATILLMILESVDLGFYLAMTVVTLYTLSFTIANISTLIAFWFYYGYAFKAIQKSFRQARETEEENKNQGKKEMREEQDIINDRAPLSDHLESKKKHEMSVFWRRFSSRYWRICLHALSAIQWFVAVAYFIWRGYANLQLMSLVTAINGVLRLISWLSQAATDWIDTISKWEKLVDSLEKVGDVVEPVDLVFWPEEWKLDFSAVATYPGEDDKPGRSIRTEQLSLEKGDTVMIVGPSGLGKTSIVELLAGWFPKKWVTFDGQLGELVVTDPRAFSHSIVLVPQEIPMDYDQSVLKVVTSELELDMNLLIQLLKIAQLYDLFQAVNDLKSKTTDKLWEQCLLEEEGTDRYSGGQKTRLKLVRIIYQLILETRTSDLEPMVIILDEPDAGLKGRSQLDPGNAPDMIRQVLSQLFDFLRNEFPDCALGCILHSPDNVIDLFNKRWQIAEVKGGALMQDKSNMLNGFSSTSSASSTTTASS